MDRGHDLIDQLSFIDDLAQMLDIRSKGRRFLPTVKDFVGDSDSVLTGNADQRDRALTRGRRDSRNCVLLVHSDWQ